MGPFPLRLHTDTDVTRSLSVCSFVLTHESQPRLIVLDNPNYARERVIIIIKHRSLYFVDGAVGFSHSDILTVPPPDWPTELKKVSLILHRLI